MSSFVGPAGPEPGEPGEAPESAGRPPDLLGAVLAGGESRRFGSPKALATVGGAPMVARAVRALAGADLPVAVVTDRQDVREAAGAPVEAFLEDRVPGAGPLGGLHAALHFARQQGRTGVVLLGCDLPLVPPALVRLLASAFHAAGPTLPLTAPNRSHPGGAFDSPRPVAPEGESPTRLEPLPAVYPLACLPEVEERLGTGNEGGRSLLALLEDLGVHRVAPQRIREVADPDTAFLNVNTPADRERAEALAASPPRA